MKNFPEPVCPRRSPCKCCGAPAELYGVVDFHKNCASSGPRPVLELSGIPIYYYRCPVCRFLFSTAFDHCGTQEFRRHVYNDEYLLVDPDYRDTRPRANAALLCRLFAGGRPERVLDYGGGNGLLAELLRGAGFARADTYDPFSARHAVKPTGRYDCVVSFEVAEHSTDPARTFAEMNEFVTDAGIILFSTLVQPANIDQQGLGWWYAGPRNGHVSLYTRASLLHLVGPYRFKLASFNENLHVLYREIPAFATAFLRGG